MYEKMNIIKASKGGYLSSDAMHGKDAWCEKLTT
jgi:hypothetical protein